MGRQKIQMKKIENDEALQVCFSKRRTGLFKKASELSTLCGAEVAIVVFSPAGRPYSIGLPDMNTVLDRFLLCNPTNEEHEYYHHRNTTLMLTCHRNVIARDLNRQVMELRSLLDQQRGRRTPLEMMARNAARSIGVDSGPDFEGLNLDRLSRLESEIKQLRCRVAMRVDELMRRDNLNQPLPPPTSLPFLPEAGVPTAHLNQAGFVDPPTGFLDPDSGFFRSGGTGVANGSGPSDAPFMYSDPFPDPCAAGGACQASFPSEFI